MTSAASGDAHAELYAAHDALAKRVRELTRKNEALELQLRERERDAEYGALLNAAPDAFVVVGPDARIRLVNCRAEELFGYDRAELVGQRLELLIPERFRQSHAHRLAAFFENPSLRPAGAGFELYARRKDGSELSVEISLSPLRMEHGLTVSAAIRDVGERKRLGDATKLLGDRLASAVESIQDAFALFDHEGHLVLCNSVYRRFIGEQVTGSIVGQSYERLLDAWIGDVCFASEVERARFRAERLSRQSTDPTATFDLRMRDGRSLRVIDRRTAEGGTVKTIWDLTEDVQLGEDLRQARTAAEAASKAKSDFLSSMSHELRTPLNAILGFAQLLERDKKEPLSKRHSERLQYILTGGQHLLRLIDDILDLSRIEAGALSISTEPVNLIEVMSEVKTTLESLAAQQGIAVQLAIAAPGTTVAADRTRILQILMNFGSNGIKYNRPGGKLTFSVSQPSAEVVRVTVCDNGIGVPLDKQHKLFQPFQRAGQETGPIQGTGIGLVVSKRLAQLMGGDVGFHSTPGDGSEFWVDLPAHSSAVTPPCVPTAPPERVSMRSPGQRRRTLLYVEDNPANVMFMKDLLGNFEDINLLTCSSAEAGVDLARAQQPDIIIMDINLPGMSGLEALRRLQADPRTREIPVLALTAAASRADAQRGEAAGFYRYLTKPIKVSEFVDVLDSLLDVPTPA